MHPVIHAILSNPHAMAQIERALAARGRGGDDNIVHVNDQEMATLRAMGGSGAINPKTGLREFNQVGPGGAGGPGSQGGLGGANGDALGGHDNVGGHVGGSGAEHNGQGGFITQPGQGGGQVAHQPLPPPPPVMLPPPPPSNIPTAPIMSQTAATNLIGNRFGALPSFATTPYQIGTGPTSYPVSGQPFGVPTPPVAPPPVMPPPATGGDGSGGGAGNGGGGFNGGGVMPPPSGGGQVSPQQFWQVLQQHGIGNGTPNYQQVGQPSPGTPAANPSQMALQQLFGVGHPASAPAPHLQQQASAIGPAQRAQIMAALQGAQARTTTAGTPRNSLKTLTR